MYSPLHSLGLQLSISVICFQYCFIFSAPPMPVKKKGEYGGEIKNPEGNYKACPKEVRWGM